MVPFPFNPLAEPSRKKIRQSILAYCHLHSLHLRSLILSPVFANPLTRGGPLGAIRAAPAFPPTPTLRSRRSLESKEWEKVVASEDTPQRTLANKLSSHPPLKHPFYANDEVSPASREGSFLPLYLAHQDVLQRSLDRELKEQAIVAGLFGDILGNPPKFAIHSDPYHGPDGEFMYHWETQDIRYTHVEVLSKPGPVWPPPVPGTHTPPTKLAVSRLSDPDARAGRYPFMTRWTHWPKPNRMNIFEAIWEATKWKLNVLPSKKVTTGTIVWLTGCGEGSFVGSQGFNRAIDAAREEMGMIADGELRDMGARVSIVKTAPLSQRAARLANFWPHHPEWDPRTRADAETPDFLVERYHRDFSRANLLARISALWAVEEHAVHWIVKRAIHAPYHKRTYSFGLDVMVRDFASFVPDPLWQLFFWAVYEHLGLKTWEMWMIDKDYSAREPAWPWLWMFVPSLLIEAVFSMLGWWAEQVQEPDYRWKEE
ncbi:hypothetical protein FRB90_003590 [Tulasnella sp. 427]|nr:hypothetical protein FRB90_003590 [Tulasnella sp. 427]